MRILVVDSGTTMTRVSVMEADTVLGTRGARLGARDAARDPGSDKLLAEITHLAEGVFQEVGCSWQAVDAVVAFGMLTSELGLLEVPHLDGPVTARELAAAIRREDCTPEIPVPVFLVPGVRFDAGDGLATTDFMRGEETEVVGLLASTEAEPPLLYISAGSHCKFVAVDHGGRIAWSFTTISGELLWALAQETILGAVLDPAADVYDLETAEHGARYAQEFGLSRALFVTRLMSRLRGTSPASCSAHVHGAVAWTDLHGLETLADRTGRALPERVRIKSGKGLATAYRHLLGHRGWARDVATVDASVGTAGAWHLLAASGAMQTPT